MNLQITYQKKNPLVVAITGASGVIYGLRLIQYLLDKEQEIELVISDAGRRVLKEEHGFQMDDSVVECLIKQLNLSSKVVSLNLLRCHALNDYGAAIASGSYPVMGMVVVPCSLGTLGAIAAGLSQNLIHRAALVSLKERRNLLLVVREMPFGHIQLKNMLALSEAGAIITAASPGFYHHPVSLQDQIDFVVGKILDVLGFDNNLFKRWRSSDNNTTNFFANNQ